MTETFDGQPDTNVINFPRIGFNLTPTTTLTVPPPPDFAPDTTGPAGSGRRGRRSPLDALAAMPDPGLTRPLLPVPAADLAPAPGYLPDTFRGDDGQDGYTGARLGALSLAACLAVAVAALRGAHTFLADRRQRRLADEAENAKLREARLKMQLDTEEARGKHVLAMQGLRDKQAQQRAKRVQSGPEFGRKSLGRGGSGSGGSSGGRGRAAGRSGTGSKKPGGGPSGRGTGSTSSRTGGLGSQGKGKKNSPSLGGGSSSKNGKGAGSKTNGSGNRKGKQDKPKSPTGGKSPSSSASSPSMDRRRRRQQRADTRRAAKDKVRNDRVQAKEGRKENARQARFQAKQQQSQQKTAGKQQKKKAAAAAKAKRTTLPQAMAKAARHRLKRRRNHLAPPILSKARKQKQRKAKKTGKGNPAAGPGAANTPKNGGNTPGSGAGAAAGAGGTGARQQRTGPNRGQAGGTGGNHKRHNPGQQQAPGAAGSGGNAGQAGYTGYPGGTRQRRSPFQNAGQAAGQASGATYTVERDDYVGAQAKRWQPDAIGTGTPSLDTVPGSYPQRPGTTRPRPPIPMPPAATKPDPRIKEHQRMAAKSPAVKAVGRQMDAQHATEINLDDACDGLDKLTDDSFTVHDETARLAEKAVSLRDTWLLFADQCATEHNLIGPLFTAGALHFAESMDLVARMALEMKGSSLEAAEKTEVASNDMNDAYRPITQATADAGLTTPSAPIHNQA